MQLTKRFVVSIHDVAPPFEEQIRDQLERLAALGVQRTALLVVPNWHGRNPLPEARSLLDLLRSQQALGSEIVMHGVEHRRHGPLRGPIPLRLRAGLFAGAASEFVTVELGDAQRWIRYGRALFEEADLEAPSTFCAPGWLLDPALLPGLAQEGIERVIGMFSIYDTAGPRRCLMPAVGFMGASGLHEAGVETLNGLVRTVVRRVPSAVLYLHPQGSQNGRAIRRVFGDVERLLEAGWQADTYEAVVGCPVP